MITERMAQPHVLCANTPQPCACWFNLEDDVRLSCRNCRDEILIPVSLIATFSDVIAATNAHRCHSQGTPDGS